MPILIIILLLLTAIVFPKLIQYNRSQYKEESGNGFMETITDKEKYGEFLGFTYLEEYQIYRKLLTGFQLPKSGQNSMKVDLLMVSKAGVYVFDVNNYKGVIRGEVASELWTHHFKNNEEPIDNPLRKNRERIGLLKKKFPDIETSAFNSYVLINDSCDLQIDQREYEDGLVLKMHELIKTLNEDIEKSKIVLSREEIDKIYETLKKS